MREIIKEALKYDIIEDFIKSIKTDEIFFNIVRDNIKNKLKGTGVRITKNGIGVLSGNYRGGWMDNDNVWTFYPNHAMENEFKIELKKRMPTNVKIMAGAIDFPKSEYSSLSIKYLTNIWKNKEKQK